MPLRLGPLPVGPTGRRPFPLVTAAGLIGSALLALGAAGVPRWGAGPGLLAAPNDLPAPRRAPDPARAQLKVGFQYRKKAPRPPAEDGPRSAVGVAPVERWPAVVAANTAPAPKKRGEEGCVPATAAILDTMHAVNWDPAGWGASPGAVRAALRQMAGLAPQLRPVDACRAAQSLMHLSRRPGSTVIHLTHSATVLRDAVATRLAAPTVCDRLPGGLVCYTLWVLSKLEVQPAGEGGGAYAALCRRLGQPRVLAAVTVANLAVALNGMAQARVADGPLLQAISERLRRDALVAELSARDVAGVAWAYAVLGVRDEPLMAALAARALEADVLAAFVPIGVANLAWAFARMGILHEDLLAALATRIVAGPQPRLNPQMVANLGWAFATLGVRHEPLFAALARVVVDNPRVAANVTAAQAASTLWAFATVGVRDAPLVTCLTRRFLKEDVLSAAEPQEVANVAWACATLEHQDDPLMAALARVAQRSDFLGRLLPVDVSHFAWAFATQRVADPPLMAALAGVLLRPGFLRGAAPQALSNTLWAYAALGLAHEAVFTAVAQELLRRGPGDMHAQQVANVAWAFATAGLRHEPLLALLAEAALQPRLLVTFAPQELANVAWAYATLGKLEPPLFRAIAAQLQEAPTLAALKFQEVASAAWAFATMEIFDAGLMAAFATRIVEDGYVAGCLPRTVWTTTWAFARLMVRPDDALDVLVRRALDPDVLPVMEPNGVAQMTWALAVLDHPDPQYIAAVARLLADEAWPLLDGVALIGWAFAAFDVTQDEPLLHILTRFTAQMGSGTVPEMAPTQMALLLQHVRQHAARLPRCAAFLAEHPGLPHWCLANEKHHSVQRSNFQGNVVQTLRRLSSGSPVREEAVLADAGGHVVDMLLPAQRLVVEADGPVHFLRTPHGPVPDGSTLLKRTQLRRAGYAVVSVAYFEWNAVPPAGREEFLSCRIRTAVM